MKQIYYVLSTLLSALLIIGCTVEQPTTIESTSSKSLSPKTKGSDLEGSYHYWYQGESIPLTLNLEYLNILLSNPEMDEAELDELCQEMHLRAFKESRDGGLVKVRLSERPDSQDEYITQIHSIRKDFRINGVYPFFERGGGVEPIGTSNVFYLKLCDEEGYYDLEPMQQMAEQYGVTIVKEVPYMPNWYILSIEGSSFENSLDATNAFYESGLFADMDPAFMFNFQPCTVNDPYYGLYCMQWGINNTTNPDYDINVEGAWDYSTGDGSTIAIVDGGIEFSHSDLAANMSQLSFNAMTGSTPSAQGDDHGTHVAGIAAAVANNNLYIAGVAYNAKLMGVSHDINISSTYSAELASGISWAWQNEADVINCSWGDRCTDTQLHTTVLESAIINAMTIGRNGRGSVVVFASGNQAQTSNNMNYPANFDDRVLAVGAIGSTGYRASFSSFGPKLDVVAPGVEVLSTIPENNIGFMSGTSIATPHVSGVAALMIAANPDLTREEVVRFIEVTAKKIHTENYQYYSYRPHSTWNQEVGYGLIDATKAVSLAWHKGQTNPSNNPAVDFYIPVGATTYNDGTIVINSFPTIQAFFYVPTSLENMSYTYYWYYTLSGDPYWSPTYYYYGYTSGIQMTIPRPNSNSILSLTCDVFNGSTYICTVHRDFHVLPNFPS